MKTIQGKFIVAVLLSLVAGCVTGRAYEKVAAKHEHESPAAQRP